MGCGTEFACKTCKVRYYCGYGSASSGHNRAQLFKAEEHDGHDVVGPFSEDYTSVDANGDLYLNDDYGGGMGTLYVPGYKKMKYVNLRTECTI